MLIRSVETISRENLYAVAIDKTFSKPCRGFKRYIIIFYVPILFLVLLEPISRFLYAINSQY